MFLKDINNGTFLTLDEFYQRFKFKPSFLQYSSLLSSIPMNWKQTAKKDTHILSNEQDKNHTLNIQGKLVPLCKLTCKDIYWILINSCKDSTLCIQKWSEILNLEIPISDYKKIFIANYLFSVAHKLVYNLCSSKFYTE